MNGPVNATMLAPLVNGYTVSVGPPKTIVVSQASQLAALQEVTINGTLLKKQLVTLALGRYKPSTLMFPHRTPFTRGATRMISMFRTTRSKPNSIRQQIL
jgi:hypothetical protein